MFRGLGFRAWLCLIVICTEAGLLDHIREEAERFADNTDNHSVENKQKLNVHDLNIGNLE